MKHRWLSASPAWTGNRLLYWLVLAYMYVRGWPHLTGIKLIPDAQPRAAIMARIGLRAWLANRFIPADQAAPLYVRDKVAFTIKERGQGQGGNPRAVPLSAQQITPGSQTAVSPESQARSQVIGVLQQKYAIRPMTQQDIAAVVDIERRVQSHPWTEGNFFDALKAGYEAWVVCHGSEVVAFSLQLMAPDVAHLLLIGVAPDWQGKGIGAGLLAWGEQRLLLQQLESQVLEVRPSNTGAIAFYRRWGYEQIGVRKGYYPDGVAIAKMPGFCRKPWYPDDYGINFSFCRRPARGASGQCHGQPVATALVAGERN